MLSQNPESTDMSVMLKQLVSCPSFYYFVTVFKGGITLSCGTYTPWNITQPLKRFHLIQF